jgi:hypothetical protein
MRGVMRSSSLWWKLKCRRLPSCGAPERHCARLECTLCFEKLGAGSGSRLAQQVCRSAYCRHTYCSMATCGSRLVDMCSQYRLSNLESSSGGIVRRRRASRAGASSP